MGANFNSETDVAGYGNAGYGGMFGGGGIMAILVVVIVLWLLFKDGFGGHRDGYGGGYEKCGKCVQDMPDYLVDRDVIAEACKTRETTVCESDKVKALITHNQERADDKAYQALVMQNYAKDNIIQTLALEKNFDGKFGMIMGELCKKPDKVPEFACSVACETFPVAPRRREFSRERDCDC